VENPDQKFLGLNPTILFIYFINRPEKIIDHLFIYNVGYGKICI